MTICNEEGHHYLAAPGDSYSKQDGTQFSIGEPALLYPGHDTSITYHTLFCTRCAHTVEIVTKNEHKLKDSTEKGVGSP